MDFPKVAGFRSCNGAIHPALPTVVGRDNQMPIAKVVVQVIEMPRSRMRGFFDVHSVVDIGVAPQAIEQARAVHKLPHAQGACPREGAGIEPAFDHGFVHEV